MDNVQDIFVDLIEDIETTVAAKTFTPEVFKSYKKGTLDVNKYLNLSKNKSDRYTYLIVNTATGESMTYDCLCNINNKIKQCYGHDTKMTYSDKVHLLNIGQFEVLIPSSINCTNSYGETIKVSLHKNLMSNELKRIVSKYKTN